MTGEVMKAVDQRLQLLNKVTHMTVYAASGDCGAFADHVFGSLSVSYPGSDPWAVSVGGTAIITDNSDNRFKEIAWTGISTSSTCATNEWGSGGGLSQ